MADHETADFNYDNLSVEIHPHERGCELRFEQAPASPEQPHALPSFSLVLTDGGLQVLAEQIRRFLEDRNRAGA